MDTCGTASESQASELCGKGPRAGLIVRNLEQRSGSRGMDAHPETSEPLGEEEFMSHDGRVDLEECGKGQAGDYGNRDRGKGACDRVKLNVGGEIFETSTETLKLDVQSMLAAKVTRYMKDADEIIWIDRDPVRFRHVLNYLRTRTLCLDDVSELKGVQEEADFFNLAELHHLCEEKIQETVNLRDETKRMLQKLEELHGNLKTLTENLENLRTNQRKEPITGVRRRRLDYNEPVFRMDEDF